jgi:two-component sensor histidine kinase
LQARSLTDPAVKAIFSASQNRIQAIALVHEKLYRSASLSHIDFADHIVTLVDGLFHAYDATDHGIAREYDLSGPRLAIDLAIPCGLIVNELVSNCLKHGFRGRPSGLIRVAFRRLGAERLELRVEDDGVGLPADLDPSQTRSLGLDLVSTFAEQIGAEMKVERRLGTRFRFSFSELGPNE